MRTNLPSCRASMRQGTAFSGPYDCFKGHLRCTGGYRIILQQSRYFIFTHTDMQMMDDSLINIVCDIHCLLHKTLFLFILADAQHMNFLIQQADIHTESLHTPVFLYQQL